MTPSLLPLRIVENRFSPVASGRLFRPRADIGNGILSHGHRVIETSQPDAYQAVAPDLAYASFDLNRVAGGNLSWHQTNLSEAQNGRI